MKRRVSVLSIVIIVMLGLFFYFYRIQLKEWWLKATREPVPAPTSAEEVIEDINRGGSDEEIELPESINLEVPFTSQAPLLNWDEAHNEACEEAASLMVAYFWQQKDLGTAEEIDAELLDIEDFESDYFGDFRHTTAEQTAELIEQYYGFNQVDVYYDITVNDIKNEVGRGYPVIVPSAGRLLGNPYFTQPGPVYHMLVVKGYQAGGDIITNDNGTKRGADYTYDPGTFYNAIHDWYDEDIEQGRKAIIVVRPND
jgi:hypothetical protein